MAEIMDEKLCQQVTGVFERNGYRAIPKDYGDGCRDYVLAFERNSGVSPIYVDRRRGIKKEKYFRVAVHPDLFDASLTSPNIGILEDFKKNGENKHHHTGYKGFKDDGSSPTPYAKCYRVEKHDLQALDILLKGLTGQKLPIEGRKKQSAPPEENLSDPPTPEEDIANCEDSLKGETERHALIDARRGQGKFRLGLLDVWGECAVSGCKEHALLRASHIQPWRDSSNINRLNVDNGLLLSASLDAAFDRWLISFEDDGRILISSLLSAEDAAAVGIHSGMRLRKVPKGSLKFLAIHRQAFKARQSAEK